MRGLKRLLVLTLVGAFAALLFQFLFVNRVVDQPIAVYSSNVQGVGPSDSSDGFAWWSKAAQVSAISASNNDTDALVASLLPSATFGTDAQRQVCPTYADACGSTGYDVLVARVLTPTLGADGYMYGSKSSLDGINVADTGLWVVVAISPTAEGLPLFGSINRFIPDTSGFFATATTIGIGDYGLVLVASGAAFFGGGTDDFVAAIGNPALRPGQNTILTAVQLILPISGGEGLSAEERTVVLSTAGSQLILPLRV